MRQRRGGVTLHRLEADGGVVHAGRDVRARIVADRRVRRGRGLLGEQRLITDGRALRVGGGGGERVVADGGVVAAGGQQGQCVLSDGGVVTRSASDHLQRR